VILLRSWVRRKRFEARLIANEVGQLFGGSVGSTPTGNTSADRVHPDQMLQLMGVTL